jgi:hypothetical protein
MLISSLDIKEDNMTDDDHDPSLDPQTPMGGAVAAGLLRRQADGSYIAYNSPMGNPFAPAPLDRTGELAVALGWHPLYTHPQAVEPLTPAAWQRPDGTRVPDPPGWATLLAEVDRLRAALAQARQVPVTELARLEKQLQRLEAGSWQFDMVDAQIQALYRILPGMTP